MAPGLNDSLAGQAFQFKLTLSDRTVKMNRKSRCEGTTLDTSWYSTLRLLGKLSYLIFLVVNKMNKYYLTSLFQGCGTRPG